MKKLICILVVISVLLALFGCASKKPSVASTTPADDGAVTTPAGEGATGTPEETVITDEITTEEKPQGPKTQFVLGKAIEVNIAEAPELSTLVLEVDTLTEQWGDTVLVYVSESLDAEHYYVNAKIEVLFTEYEESSDPSYSYVIKASKITNMAYAYYKPIIYLYPETATVCSVELRLNGSFTCTYPSYNDGWKDFTAYPDGTLIFPDGKEYYALYWEGLQDADWDLTQGFCVRGEDTAEFLEWALSAQGLTRREANEFIVFWLPLMEDNPYNVISFQTKAYNDTAVLEVSPKPDSVIRVFMTFYSSDTEVSIPAQSFTTPTRNGFTVVEWGGSEIVK